MGLRRTHMNESRFEPVQCRIDSVWDGQGCLDSGYVNAVQESYLGGAF
jgi:hypothetical protein